MSTPTGSVVSTPTAHRVGRLHVLVDSLLLAEAALEGGAPTLQVRVKDGSDRRRFEIVAAIAERCRDAGATCLVNDRADFAVASGADGVHVGAEDLSVAATRRVVGSHALVGATARDPVTGRRLVDAGATYLGVGPAYATTSKDGLPAPLGLAGVRAVAEAVPVPVIAIAGITPARVAEVLAAGAWGIAVIGAVAAAEDPHQATHDLVTAVAKAVDGLGETGETGRRS
jgi:thiamine-phosphate pyrophosphorylase